MSHSFKMPFEGFSESDFSKLDGENKRNKTTTGNKNLTKLKKSLNTSSNKRLISSKTNLPTVLEIPPEARLSSSKEDEDLIKNQENPPPDIVIDGGGCNSNYSKKVEDDECNEIIEDSQKTDDNVDKLQQFQDRQKAMEEENKKLKNLLRKEILDRTKKTSDEAEKLKQVQGELSKIDVLLGNDVKLLRSSIEDATLSHSDAQRRFEKAENEYVAAKLDLHAKRERKEMLTEHLCTIIEQNELRKAKKLKELMAELDIN